MKRCATIILALILAMTSLLCSCSGKSPEGNNTTGGEGGTDAKEQAGAQEEKASDFIVAVATDIVSFDLMTNTNAATNQVMYHVYEQLTMLDYTSKLNPQLATSWETNDDNTEWILHLKENVLFHDGSAFDSEDVLASVERYQRIGQRATIFQDADVEAVDQYTVKFTLAESNPLFLEGLGTEGMGGIIMLPAEYCTEEYDSMPQEACIGTGPYMLDTYEPNTEIVLKKFDGYIPDEGENNGYGGEKIAYFDTITWKVVPDAAQRLNGLLAGEYQYANELDATAYSTLEASEGIEIMQKPGEWIPFTIFNSINSAFSDIRMRQALILCLDMDECMLAAASGNPNLYELGSSMFFENQVWFCEAGSEWYNKNDDEKAKQLLAEAGYNGEELKWVVTQDYAWMYDVAVVVQQQAKEIGMNIVLDVYDWTTCVSMLQNGKKEKEFDLWTTGFSYPDVVDPSGIDSLFTLDTVWPYESAEMDAIVKSGHSADTDVRIQAYQNLIDQWYKDMYGIIYGKLSGIAGYSSDVEVCQQYTNLRFFNCYYK